MIEAIERARSRLAARSDLFAVEDPKLGPVVDPRTLAEIEVKLGAVFPPVLRAIYTEVASSIFFTWRILEGEEDRLGYEESSAPHGRLELFPAAELDVTEEGVIRLTSNGWGDGYALEPATQAIVWFSHEEHAISPRYPQRCDSPHLLLMRRKLDHAGHGDSPGR